MVVEHAVSLPCDTYLVSGIFVVFSGELRTRQQRVKQWRGAHIFRV